MNYTYTIHDPASIINGISKVRNIYHCYDNNTLVACTSIDITTSNGLTINTNTNGNTTLYSISIPVVNSNQLVGISSSACVCTTANVHTIHLHLYGLSGINPVIVVEINSSIGGFINNFTVQINIEVINNTTIIDEDDITIMIASNLTKPWIGDTAPITFGDSNYIVNKLLDTVNKVPVRYTNSYSDLQVNTDKIPFIAIQDRFFVNGNDNNRSSVNITIPNQLTMSGWTDYDARFFVNTLYVNANTANMPDFATSELIDNIMLFFYTLMPFTFWRTGQAFINVPDGTMSVYSKSSFFHDFGALNIIYQGKELKPLTAFLYHRLEIINNPDNTKSAVIYFYYFDNYQTPTVSYNYRTIQDVSNNDAFICILPVDYNVCVVIEGQSDVLVYIEQTSRKVLSIDRSRGRLLNFTVIYFDDMGRQAKVYTDEPPSVRLAMKSTVPVAFASGGGLLGLLMSQTLTDFTSFYLFPWYKLLKSYALNTNNRILYPRFDSYYAYIL